MSYDSINQKMSKTAKTSARKSAYNYLQTGDTQYLYGDNSLVKTMIKEWFAETFTKLMSEQLFVPIENIEKGNEYLPFQWLAKYFESLGIKGIIYQSTVCSGSKNIVLFDKQLATAIKKNEFWIK